ncbi:MAG: hypothetical protein ACD_2C00083G0004 [uncultured bacterium (gcode 4)]|uniref:HMA domain-containing protein n=1 Tax=uncultured bacterium (gcode 4) TaxID=1234023 RepID=K2FF91_9BACT|nr:MAG: hypothetical protein ACD_2C00083G0004 [uncultured bacterium (gcode 4)]
MWKIILSMPAIHCESCTKLIKMALSWVVWIADPKIDLTNKTLEVNIDEEMISKEELIHLLKEESWFESSAK